MEDKEYVILHVFLRIKLSILYLWGAVRYWNYELQRQRNLRKA